MSPMFHITKTLQGDASYQMVVRQDGNGWSATIADANGKTLMTPEFADGLNAGMRGWGHDPQEAIRNLEAACKVSRTGNATTLADWASQLVAELTKVYHG